MVSPLAKGTALGMIVLAVVISGACAPSTPDFAHAATVPPLPRATQRPPVSPVAVPTFVLPTTTPGPTQTPPAILAVQAPPEVASVLSAMSALARRLYDMALGAPESSQIVAAARQATELMAQASRVMPQMAPLERAQTFSYEASLLQGLVQNLASHPLGIGAQGPTVPIGTPEPVAGVALTVRALPPASPAPSPELLARDLARIQSVAADLAKGKPTSADVVPVVMSFQSRVTVILQLAETLPAQDAQQLATATAVTMDSVLHLLEATLR